MILVVPPLQKYEADCRKFKKFIDSFDREGDWFFERFTLLNPFEFYGFGDKAKVKQILTALSTSKIDMEKCSKGYNDFLKIREDVLKIREDIKKWDQPD